MMKMSSIQKPIAFSLILSFIIPFGFFMAPKKSEAQVFVPVFDLANLEELLIIDGLLVEANYIATQTAIATGAVAIKEVGVPPGLLTLANAAINQATGPVFSPFSLDFWATAFARIAVKVITQNIINWINSGFAGQPAFVRDPGQFFIDVADITAGEFINGSELGFLCEPFSLDIRFILSYNYSASPFEDFCKLSEVLDNIGNFFDFTNGNFYAGGWKGWFSIIHPNNNVYGSYLKAEAELSARIRGRQNIELFQLNWNSGFLSFQECEDPPGAPLNECKKKGPVKTPGVVIESGLSNVLDHDLRELELADSIDRIILALFNYFLTQALGPEGLFGSAPQPSRAPDALKPHIPGKEIDDEKGEVSIQENSLPTPPPDSIVFGDSNKEQDVAQGFKLSNDGKIKKVQLYIKKIGNPGNLTVRITPNDKKDLGPNKNKEDIPLNNINKVVVSTNINASLIGQEYSWVEVNFNKNPKLEAGKIYWIVIDSDTGGPNKHYEVGANSIYFNGEAKLGRFGNSSSWEKTNPEDLSLYFKVFFQD